MTEQDFNSSPLNDLCVITWNVDGLGVADLSLFTTVGGNLPMACLVPSRGFQETDILSVDWGHRLLGHCWAERVPWFSNFYSRGVCISFKVTFLGSGVRWVTVTVPGVALPLGFHLPHKRQTFLQFWKSFKKFEIFFGFDVNVPWVHDWIACRLA